MILTEDPYCTGAVVHGLGAKFHKLVKSMDGLSYPFTRVLFIVKFYELRPVLAS